MNFESLCVSDFESAAFARIKKLHAQHRVALCAAPESLLGISFNAIESLLPVKMDSDNN